MCSVLNLLFDFVHEQSRDLCVRLLDVFCLEFIFDFVHERSRDMYVRLVDPKIIDSGFFLKFDLDLIPTSVYYIL